MREFKISDHISQFFTYHEALWLPGWNRHADVPNDGLSEDILVRLQHLFQCLDGIRLVFNASINVHVAYRPPVYNFKVGGAKDSAHMAIKESEAAVDFDVSGISCEKVRSKIISLGLLGIIGLRMEDNGSEANWIHLDSRIPPSGHSRFFKP